MSAVSRNSSQSNKIFGANNNAEGEAASTAENGNGEKERGRAYDDETEETTYRLG